MKKQSGNMNMLQNVAERWLSILRKWLIDLREAAGMSQAGVARALGVSRQYYGFIEQGVRLQTLTLPLMVKISKLFKITVNQITKLESERIST